MGWNDKFEFGKRDPANRKKRRPPKKMTCDACCRDFTPKLFRDQAGTLMINPKCEYCNFDNYGVRPCTGMEVCDGLQKV